MGTARLNNRPLGRTGLQVSTVAPGTVSLGMDYGIEAPGEFGRPAEAEAIRITKVSVPTDANGSPLHGVPLQRAVQSSLESSLSALQRDVLDIVQIHNATVDIITQGEMANILIEARHQVKVRFLGASVYGEEAALAVIEAGRSRRKCWPGRLPWHWRRSVG